VDWHALIVGCLTIFIARLFDVSFDTLRMVAVIRGRRGWAWVFAFAQVLIWLYAINYAMKRIDEHPAFPITYALGFACGNFLGITVESWLAHGEQVIRVFTRPDYADPIAARLRGHGYGVTVFDGRGKDGPVCQLFVESTRKRVADVARLCRAMDPLCYYVIDDVLTASTARSARGVIRPVTPADLRPLAADELAPGATRAGQSDRPTSGDAASIR
jgi:uncharacterized protein YebE (UPF0316 family)